MPSTYSYARYYASHFRIILAYCACVRWHQLQCIEKWTSVLLSYSVEMQWNVNIYFCVAWTLNCDKPTTVSPSIISHLTLHFCWYDRAPTLVKLLYNYIVSYLHYFSSCRDDTLQKITPYLLQDRPNTYTYTKAVAESIIFDESTSLPVVIIRPSVVGASLENPVPVYFISKGRGAIHIN